MRPKRWLKGITAVVLSISSSLCLSQQTPHTVGFSSDGAQSIQADFEWLGRQSMNSLYLKPLIESNEHLLIKGQSWRHWIHQRIPIILSDDNDTLTCSKNHNLCQNSPSDSSLWDLKERSEQRSPFDIARLYTPYLDRKGNKPMLIQIDPERLLSVTKPSHTIAIVDRETLLSEQFKDSTEGFKRIYQNTAWIALARMHEVFIKNGKALGQCQLITGERFHCDPYADGVHFYAGSFLIAMADRCNRCRRGEVRFLAGKGVELLLKTPRSETIDGMIREHRSVFRDFYNHIKKDDMVSFEQLLRWRQQSFREGPKAPPR